MRLAVAFALVLSGCAPSEAPPRGTLFFGGDVMFESHLRSLAYDEDSLSELQSTLGAARKAAELGVTHDNPDLALLTHDREGDLIRTLGEFPAVVKAAAELREPHRVARYAEELAGTFHRFYDNCQILPKAGEETEPIHGARLALAAATRQTLANALGLVGVTAPERM